MTRSDLIKKLFLSYSHGDDAAFRSAARDVISDERRKRHTLVADELEHALNRDRRPGDSTPLTMRPIPKARDDRPLLQLSKPRRTFEELVFPPEVADELEEIAEENRNRHLLAGHGLRPRQTLLFLGPPGTGKSAAAHAMADYLSLPVASVSLSTLTSSYLGETAKNIESTIRFAESVPCVLLYDEFDSVASDRGARTDHGEMSRVTATVLQLFEGLDTESLLISTSNHPASMDPAMWRRFDDVVNFLPLERAEVGRLLREKLGPSSAPENLDEWAAVMEGFSPAEIESVCTQALRLSLVRGDGHVADQYLQTAYTRMQRRRAQLAQLSSD